MTLDHFVGMVTSNVAKIIGLYSRKGALAVGSDADTVVLDMGLEKTIHAADLHETDHTPWEGHVVTVWPSSFVDHRKASNSSRHNSDNPP